MERLLTLYSEVQSTDVRWLWYPFIAIGKITLLQGDPGDGKSTMMMNLIAELSTGGKTPDGCRPQSFENQKPDRKPEFESEQQKAVYWIKHFLEKGDMSANEIYCRLDNEGVSKRVARMVKTEMGIHCYQKKRKWYWSVQPEEGAMNGSQV